MTDAAARIVWLASYPKSGNTWVRIMLDGYRRDREAVALDDIGTDGIASARNRFDEVTGLASSDLDDDECDLLRPRVYETMAAELDDVAIVKVHDANHLTPAGEPLFPAAVTRAAVYLVRNPLDVAVSYTFHHGGGDLARTVARMGDPDTVVAGGRAVQLRQRMGHWSDHVRGWRDGHLPVRVVRYEDLVEDPARELDGIVRHIGIEADDHEARVARSVERSRFDALQEAERAGGFRERTRRQERFFRSGRVGDWRDHLDAEQVDRVVADHGEVMAELGYLDGAGRPIGA